MTETLVDNTCPGFLSFSNGGELDDISVHRLSNDVWEYEGLDQSFPSQVGDQRIGHASQVTLVHHDDGRVDLYSDSALSGEMTMLLPRVVTRARNEIGRSSYNGCEFLNGNIAEVVVYARGLQDFRAHERRGVPPQQVGVCESVYCTTLNTGPVLSSVVTTRCFSTFIPELNVNATVSSCAARFRTPNPPGSTLK